MLFHSNMAKVNLYPSLFAVSKRICIVKIWCLTSNLDFLSQTLGGRMYDVKFWRRKSHFDIKCHFLYSGWPLHSFMTFHWFTWPFLVYFDERIWNGSFQWQAESNHSKLMTNAKIWGPTLKFDAIHVSLLWWPSFVNWALPQSKFCTQNNFTMLQVKSFTWSINFHIRFYCIVQNDCWFEALENVTYFYLKHQEFIVHVKYW